ncbi:MAG TPA: cytochrome c biogenesis protein CcdA [Gemmatimonadales bacterium]|jgi:cytochrome c-type biogenesis protein
MNESVGLAVAFGAGVLSFLSPCVLPLVPSYVSFITGLSLDEMGAKRWTAVTHALLFVTGFTLIFLGLGAGATQLGVFLKNQQVWLERVGGLLVVFFGLYMMGALRLGVLDRDRRVHLRDKPVGYLGSVLVGLAFGAGWTPCIGPILGAILTFTAAKASLSEGMVLLLAYSLGLAVPFLIAALAVDRFIEWFKQYRRHLGVMMKVSGALLIVFGVMLLTGTFTLLASWLQSLTPDFLRERI